MKLLDEFKEFALKSDFVGMATAFVMGAAVGTVVKSLVNDVIMPPIGLALGGTDFSKLAIELKQAAGETPAAPVIGPHLPVGSDIGARRRSPFAAIGQLSPVGDHGRIGVRKHSQCRVGYVIRRRAGGAARWEHEAR